MYENEEPVLRRIVWIVLWFVIIVAVAWAVVWLAFFHNSSPSKQNGGLKSKVPQSQSSQTPKKSSGTSNNSDNKAGSGSQNSKSSTSSGSGNSASTTPAAGSDNRTAQNSGSSAQTPSTLANTGAGDVLIPFAVATMAGSAIYYVRLSKKIARSSDS